MALYQGDKPIVDRYVGSRFVERVYHGSNLLFDAYTEVTGLLPIVFKSRATAALKNYLVHGTSEGAGVQTDNLYNYRNQDPDNGYVNDNYIKSNGGLVSNTAFEVSEYVPIEGNTTYYLYWRVDSSSVPGYAFYDKNKERVGGGTYGERQGAYITAPSNARFLRFSVRKAVLYHSLIGLYMTKPDVPVPYGYKIPLTVTSGEQTDNYPLYIGDAKLGAEEYVDYESGKMWKYGTNVYDKDDSSMHYGAGYAIINDTSVWTEYDGSGHTWRVPCTPNTTYKITIPNATQIFKISTVRTSAVPTSVRPAKNISVYGLYVASEATKEYIYTTDSSALYIVMQFSASEASDITEGLVVQAFLPTDPSVPFPAITAYKGENTLSSTEVLGNVTVKGRIKEKEYLPVEYLKSTGTQYIQTDIIPNYSTAIDLDIKFGNFLKPFDGSTYDANILGVVEMENGSSKSAYTVDAQQHTASSDVIFHFYLGHFNWSYSGTSITVNSSNLETRGDLIAHRGGSSWQSTSCTADAPIAKQEPTSPMAILGIHTTNHPAIPSGPYCTREVCLYNAKIYLDGGSTISHNLIPVERQSDGELGLYDTITDKFYTNAGTGVFVKGAYIEESSLPWQQGGYEGAVGATLTKTDSSFSYYTKTIRADAITLPANTGLTITSNLRWSTTARIANSSSNVLEIKSSNSTDSNPIVIEPVNYERKIGVHTVRVVDGSVVDSVPSDYGEDLIVYFKKT